MIHLISTSIKNIHRTPIKESGLWENQTPDLLNKGLLYSWAAGHIESSALWIYPVRSKQWPKHKPTGLCQRMVSDREEIQRTVILRALRYFLVTPVNIGYSLHNNLRACLNSQTTIILMYITVINLATKLCDEKSCTSTNYTNIHSHSGF